jgi:uncharacterized membrane protein
MLPVALACPFLIAPLVSHFVASCSGLSIFACPFGFLAMLPVALVCPFLLPLWFSLYVTSCSCLSIFDCPFCFLSMLPIALVCPFLIAPLVFSLCCQLLWFVHF